MPDVSRASSPVALRPPPLRLSGFFGRLVVLAVALVGLALANPALFPRAVRPFLAALDELDGASYRIEAVDSSGNLIAFTVHSTVLRAMRKEDGEPGPDVSATATWPAFALQLYPVLAFSLTLALAWGARGRRILAALALAALLAPLAAAADAQINILVTAAKAVSQQWAQLAPGFPSSPENLETFRRIQQSFHRFTEVKTALNAGGRLFLAVLIGLLASLPLLRRPPAAADSDAPARSP